MPVADSLSPAAADLWRTLAEPDERVLLTAAGDVRADGSYGPRWIVITDRRVVVLPDGEAVSLKSLVLSPESDVASAAAAAGNQQSTPSDLEPTNGSARLRTADLGLRTQDLGLRTSPDGLISVPLSAL